MSSFFVLRLEPLLPIIRSVDVNGFKFLYKLLAASRGQLRTADIPLRFQPRVFGSSKLDLAIPRDMLWAQLAGILVVFVWNYVASSRFVWNTP